MSDCKATRSSSSGTPPRPLVQFRTFGMFIARVGGRPPIYKGNGAGKLQLRSQLIWLVGHYNIPVTWRSLREAAGGYRRNGPLVRPFYMVAGLFQMLRRWGMGTALLHSHSQVTLTTHASWSIDTEELSALVEAAEEYVQSGDAGAAIGALEQAAVHCGDRHGHRFLAELTDQLPPTHQLRARASYWTGVQRLALHQLTRLCLATGERARAYQALATARRAIDLDGCSRADYYLAADAADACGRPTIADQYRRMGDQFPP